MAKANKRAESILKRVRSGIEDLFADSYQKLEQVVARDYASYERQIASYKKKSQVIDIASRYLKNGTKTVSAADRKKVGATYAKKLEQVVAFNVKYQKASKSSKEVPGLKRQVKTLETAKSRLQTRYDDQKSKYDTRIANLQKKYAEAEFVKVQIAKLRGMSLREYQTNLRTEASEKAFIESTYYNEKPTEVTYVLEDNIGLIKTKKRLEDMSEVFFARIDAIRKGKDPDEAQKAIEAKTNQPKKSVKKAKKKKK